ncbi:hypothetical protein GCM10009745_48340 [Kribbella yunnanensis]|uniref:Lipocalin-like domain-containing protein n=1 Tax=Kribbella yunnanensis TaxID=190194 RepID=A0ABP4TZR4_9ACTN
MKSTRRIAAPAAIALALLVVSTGPAAAAAEVYVEAAATLDGKWKALGTYYRNLDGTVNDQLCVRTYNSVAGAESYAAIKDAHTGEFYAWVFDTQATDGEPACTPRRDFRLAGKDLVLIVEHKNASGNLDARKTKPFTG